MIINDENIASLQPLADEGLGDGYKFIQKTIEEWKSGANTFSKEGEKLWGISIGNELIACGGLNQDIYTDNKATGRVRHIYVLKKYRRKGFSKILLSVIVKEARTCFNSLRLFTNNTVAATLYESSGFEKTNETKASHIIRNLSGFSSPPD